MWVKVTTLYKDIDDIIAQIDYIRCIQDEEIFDEIKDNVIKIGLKKSYLDSL